MGVIEWFRYERDVRRAVSILLGKRTESTALIEKENEELRHDLNKIYASESDMLDVLADARRMRHKSAVDYLEEQVTLLKRNLSALHTTYLIKQSSLLGVPLPSPEDAPMWLPFYRYWHSGAESEVDSRTLLSDIGIHTVRAAIRKEKKERFEPWKDRAGFLFGAGGFAVAALALLLRIIEVTKQ
ncbi:hypothetical protein [Mesorhizobium sp. B1-1-5]|uniref:hypothetical protein n=1 Tax=Mesorhizobium sp. B1-1-5 TaxID=2589979 RepID=UPI00112D2AE9|nr:hypothetical protein [Mesorhizobium sp. B1-1-5]TPO08247.1 hypothetical protein FJ980_11355 [Mesorhizobium sp. B1-1-5]